MYNNPYKNIDPDEDDVVLEKPNLEKPAFKVFKEQKHMIEEECCPMCRGHIKIEDFKDELSKKEFSISGMCQKCQDDVFK